MLPRPERPREIWRQSQNSAGEEGGGAVQNITNPPSLDGWVQLPRHNKASKADKRHGLLPIDFNHGNNFSSAKVVLIPGAGMCCSAQKLSWLTLVILQEQKNK
jgi:hypothetical protein